MNGWPWTRSSFWQLGFRLRAWWSHCAWSRTTRRRKLTPTELRRVGGDGIDLFLMWIAVVPEGKSHNAQHQPDRRQQEGEDAARDRRLPAVAGPLCRRVTHGAALAECGRGAQGDQ